MKLLVVLVGLLVAVQTQAAYENTRWGMKVGEVKKLYPGGDLRRESSGEETYALVRRVGTLDAVLVFSFTAKQGLYLTALLFGKTDTEISITQRKITPMQEEGAVALVEHLAGLLELKYGARIPAPIENTKRAYGFRDASGDFILVSTVPDGQGRWRVVVGYSSPNVAIPEGLTEGL